MSETALVSLSVAAGTGVITVNYPPVTCVLVRQSPTVLSIA